MPRCKEFYRPGLLDSRLTRGEEQTARQGSLKKKSCFETERRSGDTVKYEYVSVDLYLASPISSCIRAEATAARHVPLQPKRASRFSFANNASREQRRRRSPRHTTPRSILQTSTGRKNVDNRRLPRVFLVILRRIFRLLRNQSSTLSTS